MSQDLRNQEDGDKRINRLTIWDDYQKDCNGFEGMNYEQLRQPYNQKHTNRNHTTGERKDGKRPDES
ncbi:MAG: hypothetical protein JWR72_321 [Flavisolibacter sp.]|jgi:hypothetical protein|nr:hypothetical protein [Flavisolibacter sp.]